MTIDNQKLAELLQADVALRAKSATNATPEEEGSDTAAAREYGIRLMNTWPREAKPVFAALAEQLRTFGYNLSPLHPGVSNGQFGSRRALQTELYRATHADRPFAPLIFLLNDRTGEVRIFVQQFGGRSAPDFQERHISVEADIEPTWLDGILRDYIACMLRPRAAAAA